MSTSGQKVKEVMEANPNMSIQDAIKEVKKMLANTNPKNQEAWMRASAEANMLVSEQIDGRDDIIIRMGPGITEEGHVAYTDPRNGDIVLDSNALGDLDPAHWSENKVARGLLTHEAAHASHSLYAIPEDVDDELGSAAAVLEEARAESRQIARRPQDRDFLNASAKMNLQKAIDYIDRGGALSPDQAAEIAANILARVDAGILDEADVAKVRDAVEGTLTARTMRGLETAYQSALRVDDTDWDGMSHAAGTWIRTLKSAGIKPPSAPHPQDDGGQQGQGQQQQGGGGQQQGKKPSKGNGQPQNGDDDGTPQQQVMGKANAPSHLPPVPKLSEEKEENLQQRSRALAKNVFGESSQTIAAFRPPTDKERSMSWNTRRLIQAAYLIDKTRTRVASAVPPGRLSMRDLVQNEAQRAVGLVTTPEPFRRKETKRDVAPPLHVGIIQDVSGSQDRAAEEASSAAWALATAVRGIPESEVMMVAAGSNAYKVFGPFEDIPGVPVIDCSFSDTAMNGAMAVLEGQMDLLHDNGARLLVMITDGYFTWPNRDRYIRRYVDAGVRVLFVFTGDADPNSKAGRDQGYDKMIPGRAAGATTVLALDGRGAAKIIARATVDVLEKEREQ